VQKTVEPIEVPCTGLTRAGSRNNLLGGWAHFALPDCTFSCTDNSTYRSDSAYICNSTCSLIRWSGTSVTLNFPYKQSPAMRLFVKILGQLVLIIRPHRSRPTLYIDAAYCYWTRSVVCMSQYWALQKQLNDQDAISLEDSGGPSEPCIR